MKVLSCGRDHPAPTREGLALILSCLFVLALAGCQPGTPQVAPAEAPAVPVSHPVEREVTDYIDFTGQTHAKEAVNIVPRVTGYLINIPFKEGSEVKANDLLFEIDPRPYKAQLDQAEGQVTLYKAQLALAESTLARDLEIAKTPGAVSLQQPDQDRAARGRGQGSRRGLQGQHRGLQSQP